MPKVIFILMHIQRGSSLSFEIGARYDLPKKGPPCGGRDNFQKFLGARTDLSWVGPTYPRADHQKGCYCDRLSPPRSQQRLLSLKSVLKGHSNDFYSPAPVCVREDDPAEDPEKGIDVAL